MLLEVRDLTKTYEEGELKTPALQGVSFSVREGEWVAIMGPSGSGKSTLLHMLGFLDRPSSGSYRFEGTESERLTDDALAAIRNTKVGFVFQMFNLLPRTTVLENVKLPLLYSRVPKAEWDARARDALHAVGMTHRLSHVPSQLSGGERQRVAIARALVNHPRLILADEPTGNLDSRSGQTVMESLEQLHRHGHTILLITHETYTAEYAERVLRLQDGRVVSDERVAQRRARQRTFQK